MEFPKLEAAESEKISYTIIKLFVDMIKSGQLNPGDKLPPERSLILQLGCSRASLREALSALSVIGVLESNQGGGSYIGDFNLATFLGIIAPLLIRNDEMGKDLLDFRRLLELDALKLIMEKEERDTSFLHQQLDIMKEALDTQNFDLNVEADIAFHRHLFTMSDNYILQQVYTYVQFLMEKSVLFNVSKILEQSGQADTLYMQHKQLCRCIEEGLSEDAVNLLTEHLDFVKKVC